MNTTNTGAAARRSATAGGLLLAVALFTAACSSSPSTGSEVSSPNADQVELGATVYASSCASCHGSDLGGTDKGPSHLSIVYEPNHHGDDAFRSAIANGASQHHWTFGPMPPVPGLSAEEVDAVIAYVRTQQQEQGFDPA